MAAELAGLLIHCRARGKNGGRGPDPRSSSREEQELCLGSLQWAMPLRDPRGQLKCLSEETWARSQEALPFSRQLVLEIICGYLAAN